jgi:DNA-binding MarR family transcriptional regulator
MLGDSQDAELREDAFRLFSRIVIRVDPGRLDAWADLGLTMTQLRVLMILSAEDGLSARTLADRLVVTPSTLTRIMDRLVSNSLVRREVDDGDRRFVRHRLTDAGLRTIRDVERFGRARMDSIFGSLSRDQLERMVLALRDLAAAFEAPEAEPSMAASR